MKTKKAFTMAELVIVMSILLFLSIQAKDIIYNMKLQTGLTEETEKINSLLNDFIQDVNNGYRRTSSHCGNNSYNKISAVNISNCIVGDEYDSTDSETYINERFFHLYATNANNTSENWDDSYFFRESIIPYKLYIEADDTDKDIFFVYIKINDEDQYSDKEKAAFENQLRNGIANFISSNLKNEYENFIDNSGSSLSNQSVVNNNGTNEDGIFMLEIGF